MRRLLIILSLVLVGGALAGCGNKGPLVRPAAKAPTPSTSTAPASTPAPAPASSA